MQLWPAEKDTTMLSIVLLGVVVCCTSTAVLGFAPPNSRAFFTIRDVHYHYDQTATIRHMVPRYGPKPPPPSNNKNQTTTTSPFMEETQEEWERKDAVQVEQRKVEFNKLLDRIILDGSNTTTTDNNNEQQSQLRPETLPSLVTPHLDTILSMRGYEGTQLIQEAVAAAEATGDPDRVTQVVAACDYVLSFAEAFVAQAKSVDDQYKTLLGRVVNAMVVTKEGATVEATEVERREERLDAVLQTEREKFTPGFLRHLQGECRRIEKAPKMTTESAKLLQTLRIIQTRIVEELGKELGEAAQILGQLLGYDDDDERVAVLETGLTVRGVDFAQEMLDLTEEALRGFREDMPEGVVDPELLTRVTELHRHIVRFVQEEEEQGQSSSWE